MEGRFSVEDCCKDWFLLLFSLDPLFPPLLRDEWLPFEWEELEVREEVENMTGEGWWEVLW